LDNSAGGNRERIEGCVRAERQKLEMPRKTAIETKKSTGILACQ